MNDRPFDLSRLDTERIRKDRRKRLLVWSLPVCAAVLIFSLWVGAILLFNRQGQEAYGRADYTAAANAYHKMLALNGFERYKMEFNYGTALLGAGQYEAAQTALTKALSLNIPPAESCQVRVNLVLSLVAQADKKAENKEYDAAILLYDQAKAVVDGKDCGLTLSGSSQQGSDQSKQADEKLQNLRKEVSDKQNAAKQQRNGDNPSQSDASSDAGSQQSNETPSQDQIDTLQAQQNASTQAARERQQAQRSSSASYSDRAYDAKSW